MERGEKETYYGCFQFRHGSGKLYKRWPIVLSGKMIKGCSIYCKDTKIYENRGINNTK